MALTSINVQPAKAGAEQHDRRTRNLDYVRQDLSSRNQSWEAQDFVSVSQALAEAARIVKEKTGRSMQAKATPIREGVAVITEDTSMDQLQEFCRRCQEKWGIKALAIYTHLDEGHEDIEGKWKGNLHAHIIWQWYNQDTGKSIRNIKAQDMSEMQTILAECLNMERGKSSEKKHLSVIQQKNQAEAEKYRELTAENEQLKEQTEEARQGLVNSCECLRLSGEEAVRAFDRLTSLDIVKPNQKQVENRNNLEKEYSQEMPSKLIDLTNHNRNLNYYLTVTIRAISDMGKKLRKLADNVPLFQFKKGRMAREAELQGRIADLQWQLDSRPRNVGHAEENDILGRLYQAMGHPLVPKGKTIDDAIWDVERLYEAKNDILDDYHDLRKQLSKGTDLDLTNSRHR